MIRALFQEGGLPFTFVVADSLYGNSPDFLTAVEACLGLTYLVAIPADTRCWLHRPVLATKHYRYKGEARSKRTIASRDSNAPTVEAIAHSLHATFWYRRTVSEGTKGPITYAFARQRVTLCKESLPERTVWLVIKRTLGGRPCVLIRYQ